MATKIVAKQRAFFNGEIIKPGQIINFKGDNIPSWAKKVGSGKTEEVKTPPTPPTPPAENASGQQTLIPPGQNEIPENPDENKNENDGDYIPADSGNEIDLSKKQEKNARKVLNFLTYLQDEVHRFVITYHRSLRDKIK